VRPLLGLAIVTLLAACSGASDAPPPSSTTAPVTEVAVAAPEDEAPETEAPPAPIVPSRHELLVLFVSDAPLLPSETRLGEFLETRMRRNHRDVELRGASDEEAALARAILDHTPTGSLPATFGSAHRVLLLRFAPQRSLSDGDMRSGGIDGVVLLRPPSATPAFEAAMEGAWRLESDRWADWLAGLLRDAEGT
jgi:hypothetical protein